MALGVDSLSKTVTAAGTAEPLSATRELVTGFSVVTKSTNTGKVYIGDSAVDNTKGGIGSSISVSFGDVETKGTDKQFDLSKIYIDVDTSGEGVDVFWIKEGV